jgi:prolipoprotein diacylglyceryltransferase
LPRLLAITAPVAAWDIDSIKMSLTYRVTISLYMLPILFSLGPVTIYTYGICLAIGLFLALYWWWKMGRDEHFEEISLFDGFFLSLVIYMIVGRIGYVLLHFGELGTLYRSLALLAYPGISEVAGIAGGIVFIIFFARAKAWDTWKVLDSAAVTLSLLLVFGGLGGLLNGSNPGREVSWGLMYPGQTVARFPVDIWILVWALVTFGVVSSVRKNFRFYSWYKAEASVVREGLATLIFVAAVGLYYIGTSMLVEPAWRLVIVPGELILGLFLLLLSGYLIYRRVGRREGGLGNGIKEMRLNLLQWSRRRRS